MPVHPDLQAPLIIITNAILTNVYIAFAALTDAGVLGGYQGRAWLIELYWSGLNKTSVFVGVFYSRYSVRREMF